MIILKIRLSSFRHPLKYMRVYHNSKKNYMKFKKMTEWLLHPLQRNRWIHRSKRSRMQWNKNLIISGKSYKFKKRKVILQLFKWKQNSRNQGTKNRVPDQQALTLKLNNLKVFQLIIPAKNRIPQLNLVPQLKQLHQLKILNKNKIPPVLKNLNKNPIKKSKKRTNGNLVVCQFKFIYLSSV